MTTRVYLVRHGATELSAEDRFAGSIDVLLSDGGREQARRLGARLAREAIAVAYASPFQRTMETARLVAAPHGIDVRPVDGLREIAHGRWEGKTRASEIYDAQVVHSMLLHHVRDRDLRGHFRNGQGRDDVVNVA